MFVAGQKRERGGEEEKRKEEKRKGKKEKEEREKGKKTRVCSQCTYEKSKLQKT
jgi:hypothetical protein